MASELTAPQTLTELSPRALEILQGVEQFKSHDLDWKNGQVMGYVYYPGPEAQNLIAHAYTSFLTENGLDPLTFPSVMQLEKEVLKRVAAHLQGDADVVGNFTSGGTESIICAVKAAREYARLHKPDVTEPELLLPVTAHAAFHKAAVYLGVKLVLVPVDETSFRALPDQMEAAISPNTIMMVGSAPSYAHGVLDPIEALAELAQRRGVWLHVDACVGGWHLPYMRKAGYNIAPFSFEVPGVSSISVDLHKYAYAAKGASMVLYRNKQLRRGQIFATSDWTGYTIVNPTVQSSKTGGPMAAAWAMLEYMGDDGYVDVIREVQAATQRLIDGVNAQPELQVLSQPDMCMFAFHSPDNSVDIFHLADELKFMGWYVQPQFGRRGSPANLHISANLAVAKRVDDFLATLPEAIRRAKAQPPIDVTNLLPLAAMLKLPNGSLNLDFFDQLKGAVGFSGGGGANDLPQRMAFINHLLNGMPADVANLIFVEFVNELYVQA